MNEPGARRLGVGRAPAAVAAAGARAKSATHEEVRTVRWSRPVSGESHAITEGTTIVRVVREKHRGWIPQVHTDPRVGWWEGGATFDLDEARARAEALLGMARGEHSDLEAIGL